MLQGTQSLYFTFIVNLCRYIHCSVARHREKINNNEAYYCISGECATEINSRVGVWNAAYPSRGDVTIGLSRQGAELSCKAMRPDNRAPQCIYIMRIRSQSGHIQVGPLLIPHLFSAKQSLQIMNPQGQLQQNSCFCLQQ